jgi:hypothetical protein
MKVVTGLHDVHYKRQGYVFVHVIKPEQRLLGFPFFIFGLRGGRKKWAVGCWWSAGTTWRVFAWTGHLSEANNWRERWQETREYMAIVVHLEDEQALS